MGGQEKLHRCRRCHAAPSTAKGALTLSAKGYICIWITENKLTMLVTYGISTQMTIVFAFNPASSSLSILHFLSRYGSLCQKGNELYRAEYINRSTSSTQKSLQISGSFRILDVLVFNPRKRRKWVILFTLFCRQ